MEENLKTPPNILHSDFDPETLTHQVWAGKNVRSFFGKVAKLLRTFRSTLPCQQMLGTEPEFAEMEDHALSAVEKMAFIPSHTLFLNNREVSNAYFWISLVSIANAHPSRTLEKALYVISYLSVFPSQPFDIPRLPKAWRSRPPSLSDIKTYQLFLPSAPGGQVVRITQALSLLEKLRPAATPEFRDLIEALENSTAFYTAAHAIISTRRQGAE